VESASLRRTVHVVEKKIFCSAGGKTLVIESGFPDH